MQEKKFNINNNVLSFIHNNRNYSFDLEELEQIHLYKNCIVFIVNSKFNLIPDSSLDYADLILKVLENPNFMCCGKKHVVNLKHVKSQYIESYRNGEGYSNQHSLVLTFNNGRKEGILLNSWREAERLYHQIDDKLIEIKSNLAICN